MPGFGIEKTCPWAGILVLTESEKGFISLLGNSEIHSKEDVLIDALKKLFGSGNQRPEEDLSRNDPCWCGSGEKYKRCHMEQDLEKNRRKKESCRKYS